MKETTENDSSKNSLCILPFSINVGILRHADYNAAMAQERYSKISEAMVEGKPYSKIELLRLIQNCYPDLSSHSEAWVIYHLLKQGSCYKIGHELTLLLEIRSTLALIIENGAFLKRPISDLQDFWRPRRPDLRVAALAGYPSGSSLRPRPLRRRARWPQSRHRLSYWRDAEHRSSRPRRIRGRGRVES